MSLVRLELHVRVWVCACVCVCVCVCVRVCADVALAAVLLGLNTRCFQTSVCRWDLGAPLCVSRGICNSRHAWMCLVIARGHGRRTGGATNVAWPQ